MKNRVAKLLSIFLVIALLVGASPVRLAVYAEEDDQATETKTENAEGDKDKGSGEDKTPTPKAAPESQKDKTEADKSTPTPEPDDQKESQAPTTDGDKESDPDKTPEKEPQTTEKQEPESSNGEGGDTDISETTSAPETHKIPGKAGSTGGNPVHGYTLTLNPNYEGAAVGMYNDVTTMVLPSANRSDYFFWGWAKSADGEVEYRAGQEITLTGNLTLYAIWGKEASYLLTLNLNYEGATKREIYTDGKEVTLPFVERADYIIRGWAKSAYGEVEYRAYQGITLTGDLTLYAIWGKEASYLLSPSEYTLNGSGYTDIACTLTSLKRGYVKDPLTSEYVRANSIGFIMNEGILSDGHEHSIPFQVDDVNHTGHENQKFQGNYYSQGKTFFMSIYIDPDAYANAAPGTYTGTFTYDSFWNTDDRDIPGASGSIELTLVVTEHFKHTVTVNNGTGSGSYAEGANVTITAKDPESGKEFKEWTGTDGLTFRSGNATSPTATFTMPVKNVEVSAVYIDTEYAEHTIKVNNGSADPAKALVGTVVKLTADEAPSGKVFDKWVVNAGSVSLSNVSSSTATFTMPAENVEVTATYKDVPAGSFVIKVNNGNGNTTSLISAPGLVVNVKASDAPAGTEFEKWEVVSGTVIFANASSAATIFVMPAENVEITARYKSSLSVKGKTATVKYSKVKKKNQTLAVSKVLTFVDKGQGKLTYAKVSGNSKILINKTTGAITVKKKLKKKTYTVKVKVMASGDNSCNPSGWKTVTFKIKVK